METTRTTRLHLARVLAARGDDEAAKQAYLAMLAHNPADATALVELAALAYASGHVSAARSAYIQAVTHHPDHAVARVGLGNILHEDGDLAGAETQYRAALSEAPDLAGAHQGLARVLTDRGDDQAGPHWEAGFRGHAMSVERYRGAGEGIPLLLLVSARGGNVRTKPWIDDRVFAVTAVYADYLDPTAPLPDHAVVVNAIGDADLANTALSGAERIVTRTTAPVINQPSRVRPTGREDTARRLAGIPGVIAPAVRQLSRAAILAGALAAFPVLLRVPGFHTGQHFALIEGPDDVAAAVADLPGEALLAIDYLDARGADGLARKYRVMFIDGALYPLHLAVSADWKVHYFTASMAENAEFRDEERRFLSDMPAVLGPRAMAALAGVRDTLGLDYAGIDFGLAPDRSVLLFEANAPMVILQPDPDPMWDYRRPAITAALDAAKRMVMRRVQPAGE